MKAKHDTADQQEKRPVSQDDIAPVGARSTFLPWTLTLVFLALGYVLLGAFMLIASVILSLVQLVYVAQKINPQRKIKPWLVGEKKHRREGEKQEPEVPPAAGQGQA